jgi:hypothetical protein
VGFWETACIKNHKCCSSFNVDKNWLGLPVALKASGQQHWGETEFTVQTVDENGGSDKVAVHRNSR